MTIEEIMLHSEALIFGSDRPLSETEIAQFLREQAGEEGIEDLEKLPSALEAIVEKYSSDFYPFEVRRIGGGYQFMSKKAFHPTLARLNGEKYTKKLSAAALETLANALLDKAAEGDMTALKELGDRLEGKPAQAIVGDASADPIQTAVRVLFGRD